MNGDILTLTKDILELFEKADISTVQSIFVLKSVEMQINENMMREIITDVKKGHDNNAGIG